MKIGLVCPYSMQTPGGVQNHVLGLAGYLSAAGHRVNVLAPGRPDHQRILASGLDPAQLQGAGAAVPVPYNGSIARVNFGPLSLSRARRWLADGDFDLVHLHEPITPSISGWALVAARMPVVATFHTATPRSRTMELAGRLLQDTIAKIDAGIAVSETARTVVVRHLGRDALVIPNGFRQADFLTTPSALSGGPAHRAGRWRSGDHPRIAFLGRLDEPRKGLDVLLDAIPAIRSVHPDVEVVVAGQGRRALPSDLIVPGQIDDRCRAELLGSIDLFIAPHVARESFGMVLIEAMAAGATVVASDLRPFADLLTDGPGSDGTHPTGGQPSGGQPNGGQPDLGHLFPAGDPEGLARAVVRALAEDRSGQAARAAASTERYDWVHVGAEILDVYRSVLDRRAGHTRDRRTLRARTPAAATGRDVSWESALGLPGGSAR